MTNNFTPKKSGTAARPQLSPEEYAAKKKSGKRCRVSNDRRHRSGDRP